MTDVLTNEEKIYDNSELHYFSSSSGGGVNCTIVKQIATTQNNIRLFM